MGGTSSDSGVSKHRRHVLSSSSRNPRSRSSGGSSASRGAANAAPKSYTSVVASSTEMPNASRALVPVQSGSGSASPWNQGSRRVPQPLRPRLTLRVRAHLMPSGRERTKNAVTSVFLQAKAYRSATPES